ncbi:ABC transporter permease [Paenibacillus agri]|uniref:Transport permease protein n=1 Tax=Paenibacillus agri TaxID=2744309 RepID=A0A850EMK0_9BACL|nr:ABC transporter permease [Paenibacillus agri]NUU60990.1 ABC transporter permease [Paenibacillus agri]
MKSVKYLILLVVTIFVFLGSYHYINLYINDNARTYLQLDVKSEVLDEYQLFYSKTKDSWSETDSIREPYNKKGQWQTLKFEIPKGNSYIRIDPGNNEKVLISFKNIIFHSNSTAKVNIKELDYKINELVLKSSQENGEQVEFYSTGGDPSLGVSINSLNEFSKQKSNTTVNIFTTLLSLIISTLVYFIIRFSREVIYVIRSFLEHRQLVINLAKNDFKTKYASSYLGVLWGFISPLLTIVTYWFVFQVGLRSGDVGNIPFIVWFIAGIIPWFFFSEALSSATNAFTEYNYLVKKVVFKIELLPLVKIFSAFFVHLFFIVFIFIIYGMYGFYPNLYNFQLIYYVFCMGLLVVALSFMTSAVVLFFKDLNQIIAVVLQMGFWFTPIGWSVSMLSDFWARIFKLNPMYYIVQGFRDSLIDHVLFFERPYQTIYFWVFCLAILTISLKIFKKLKPHFSDVL